MYPKLFIGKANDDGELTLNFDDLCTHAVVVGRSGSGKTGLLITLIEEMVTAGASIILFDTKGDLTNLALPLNTEEGFNCWSNKTTLLSKSQCLSDFGLSIEHVNWWQKHFDWHIYAPGAGIPHMEYNICPSISRNSSEAEISAFTGALINISSIKNIEIAECLLREAVKRQLKTSNAVDINTLPSSISSDAAGRWEFLPGSSIDDVFSKRVRQNIARELRIALVSNKNLFVGKSLDFNYLLSSITKPSINIFYLRHLSPDKQQEIIAGVIRKINHEMAFMPGSAVPRLGVVLDECRGVLPPSPHKSTAKDTIARLLAQGRSQGVTVLLGSQNPVDFDYKALSNVGTWFIGRLRERDIVRDLKSEIESRDIDIDQLFSLKRREFILMKSDGTATTVFVRETYSHLYGTMCISDLQKLEVRIMKHDSSTDSATGNIYKTHTVKVTPKLAGNKLYNSHNNCDDSDNNSRSQSRVDNDDSNNNDTNWSHVLMDLNDLDPPPNTLYALLYKSLRLLVITSVFLVVVCVPLVLVILNHHPELLTYLK